MEAAKTALLQRAEQSGISKAAAWRALIVESVRKGYAGAQGETARTAWKHTGALWCVSSVGSATVELRLGDAVIDSAAVEACGSTLSSAAFPSDFQQVLPTGMATEPSPLDSFADRDEDDALAYPTFAVDRAVRLHCGGYDALDQSNTQRASQAVATATAAPPSSSAPGAFVPLPSNGADFPLVRLKLLLSALSAPHLRFRQEWLNWDEYATQLKKEIAKVERRATKEYFEEHPDEKPPPKRKRKRASSSPSPRHPPATPAAPSASVVSSTPNLAPPWTQSVFPFPTGSSAPATVSSIMAYGSPVNVPEHALASWSRASTMIDTSAVPMAISAAQVAVRAQVNPPYNPWWAGSASASSSTTAASST